MKSFNSFIPAARAIVFNILFVTSISGQDVGIGTVGPDYRLHVCSTNSSLLKVDNTTALNTNISSDFFFKTGAYYTAGIKTIGTTTNTARLGLFTYAAPNSAGLFERMSILDNGNVGIGINNPGYLLDINGRIRLRNGGGTAGMYLMNAANTSNVAFIGMYNDTHVGLYGAGGAGWNLVMNTTDGQVGIGTQSPDAPLDVNGNDWTVGSFINSSTGSQVFGVNAHADAVPGSGYGVRGEGGNTGLWGVGSGDGAGDRTGVSGYGTDGNGTNYGVEGVASSGAVAIGIYGNAYSAPIMWAGYFSGSVYTTGTYQGSDRKLKNDFVPISNATAIIKSLKPAAYTYKTEEYQQMHLPEGLQYGLIADEVKQVMPGAVKKAIQPAAYENEDKHRGRKLSDEVEFEAVNYTAMIPILISAMQEQLKTIEDQQSKIEDLERRLSSIKSE